LARRAFPAQRNSDWLLPARDQLLHQHPIAQAQGYAPNQWNKWNVFTADIAVWLDNNVIQREEV